MFRRALKAVGLSAAALAAGAGLLTIATAAPAGAATTISNAIQPIAPFSTGTFDSGQGVDVVISASAGAAASFTSGSAIFILECAAPGGVDPTSTTQCDGNTGYGGGSITVNTDDSIDVTNGSAPSGLPYQIFALPDALIGDTGSAGATCGLGSPNDCVLYIGEGGGSDTGMAKPHVFSQVFQVHPDSANDSGSQNPGNGTFGADAAPGAITSANHVTFTKGVSGTFNVNATGYGPPAFTETGALPPGVHLTTSYTGLTSTGLLKGIPTQGGVFPITITASNGVGTPTTQAFTLTVNGPPAITSMNAATFTQGVAGTFTATATGTPAPTFSETGALPSGVTFTSAGVLSGTATAPGTFPIVITASNGISPNATQNFTLTIASAGFQITTTSLPPATINAVYGPAQFLTSGAAPGATIKWKKTAAVPKGLKFKGGFLEGTPSVKKVTPGTYPISVSATEKWITVAVVNGKNVKTKHEATVLKTVPLVINAAG